MNAQPIRRHSLANAIQTVLRERELYDAGWDPAAYFRLQAWVLHGIAL